LAENALFDVLIDELRPSVFAVGDDKKKRKGKEREGKVHKVTRRYISAICGADTPRLIPIKFGMRVAPRNVFNVSNFCNKIFRGFRSTGGQSPRFPIDFAGHRYKCCATAQPVIIIRKLIYHFWYLDTQLIFRLICYYQQALKQCVECRFPLHT